MGFRTVVNLRPETEGPADERAVVEAQGLRYVSIPVTADTFSLADVEALEKVLADPAAAPVLLHCGSSNRVGAAWAVDPGPEGEEPRGGPGGRSGRGPAQPADGSGRSARPRRARPGDGRGSREPLTVFLALTSRRPCNMDSWLGPLLILIGWIALQTWVLPRLGVPT